YLNLSNILSRTGQNLLDLVLSDKNTFSTTISEMNKGARTSYISKTLKLARTHLQLDRQGSNLIRYLLVSMKNRVLKDQIAGIGEPKMVGGLNVSTQCFPFEKMPFASSPRKNNVPVLELLKSIPIDGREHELLNRRVKHRIQQQGSLYIDVKDLASEGLSRQQAEDELVPLVERFNSKLGVTHYSRKMLLDKGQLFIQEYEDTVAQIIMCLRKLQTPVPNYRSLAEQWM